MSIFLVAMKPGYQRADFLNCALICGADNEAEAFADFERMTSGEHFPDAPLITWQNATATQIEDESRFSAVFPGAKMAVGHPRGSIHSTMLPAGQRLPG